MSQFLRRALCWACLCALLTGAPAFGAGGDADLFRAAFEVDASPKGAEEAVSRKGDDAWKAKVVKLDWYDGGDDALEIGEYGYLYDIRTGLVVHIKRTGGVNHADCEPSGRSDTQKLRKIAGGSFDWDSHPAILYADGQFIACAISTRPQGRSTIANNGYDGQFCLHMLGSKTHDPEAVNATHQKNVNRAYNWAHD